jgi:thermostable 8-oxoguanine DNA glycosylase
MDTSERIAVWHNIEAELNRRMPKWRDRIVSMEQMPALERRKTGGTWTDCEVFEALVLSVLTNSVDWSRIQPIRHELGKCFCAFDPTAYSELQHSDVEERIVWLRERQANAPYQRQGLRRLVKAAEQLLKEKRGGTIDSYIGDLYERCDRQPIRLASLLGSGATPPKLPGLGIPLAAEFLKNIGYDVAKPDRHICRAVGVFGWVKFGNWPDSSGRKSPWPSEKEMQRR